LLVGRIQAQPAGPEFLVNTTTSNRQYTPSVATNASGDFVVVWMSYLQDGDDWGVFGQRYSSAGAKLGNEFQVNTTTTGPQKYPSVAFDGSGKFVVVWQSASYPQATGQRYDSTGAKLGGEFPINTSGSASSPVIASDAAGDFVVVWRGTSAEQIFGQRFSSSGVPAGPNFAVNAVTNSASQPKVASDTAGNFVVVFNDNGRDGYAAGIFGQRYSSSGTPLGPEFLINTFTTGSQVDPAVASDGAGNFVVIWYDEIRGFDAGRRFSSSGAPLTDEFRVDTTGTGTRQHPAVSSDSAGNFVATWTYVDGGSIGVAARQFASSGAPSGSAFGVNTYTTGTQTLPSVSYASSGGKFAVAWESFGESDVDGDIYARRYLGTCQDGDVNGDTHINVGDVFSLINYLFAGGPTPSCSADVDGNGNVGVSDVFYLINYLFVGGPPPL
jgi:hypothetical protein